MANNANNRTKALLFIELDRLVELAEAKGVAFAQGASWSEQQRELNECIEKVKVLVEQL